MGGCLHDSITVDFFLTTFMCKKLAKFLDLHTEENYTFSWN